MSDVKFLLWLFTRLCGVVIALVLALVLFWVTLNFVGYYGRPNRDHATLETVVMSKEVGHYYDRDSRHVVSQYRYSYETYADGDDCEVRSAVSSVKVRGTVHKCEHDRLEVTEAEWNKVQVGQVLKRVEIK